MKDAFHQYGLANPFFHRGPIRRSEYFFNRETETNLTLDLLRNLQNVALVGQRRVGKTSLLFHLARPELHSRFGLPAGEYLFVYLDGEELLNSNASQIRSAMVEELSLTLYKVGRELPAQVKGNIAPGSLGLEYRAFRSLLRQLTGENLKIIFCFDEFDCLAANPHLNQTFFSGLRALSGQFDLAFITASKSEIQALTYANDETLSSPFFNTFASLHLGLFTLSGGRGLLEHLTNLEDFQLPLTVLEAILDLAGPHPLFLQIAAFHTYDYLQKDRKGLTADDWQQIGRRFLSEVGPHFDYYWEQLTGSERTLLARLPMDESQKGYDNILRRLERQCLVYHHDDRWHYLSPALEAFVRRQQVPYLLQAGSFLLDLRQRQGFWHHTGLALTKTEFDTLAHFLRHPDQVISSQELEATLWSGEYIDDPERVRSLVKSLRKSLGEASVCLETVWGVGYRFKTHP